MIDRINIHNFKSIVDLTMHLGRFNVIVGPNGCGKTNILEAISFASAASQNKLDYEYLVNRDVRVTDPNFMVNAFEGDDEEISKKENDDKLIFISFNDDKGETTYPLIYQEKQKKWVNSTDEFYRLLYSIFSEHQITLSEEQSAEISERLFRQVLSREALMEALQNQFSTNTELGKFLIYRPSEHFLRKTFETSIFPIGVHGEGLLKYLKEAAAEKNVDIFNEINNGLSLLDWFDGFKIPENLMTDEYRLSIGDRYLKDSMHYFDQRSTNDGFLFLLFYLTLFNSDDSPSFFAIDNVETALNPKLMTRLTEYLIQRSADKGKQVIITTHSPFLLDGLNLADPEQRLFVARRDIDGHTRLENIPYRQDRDMRLSQLWMSGLIGGLPDNF